MIECRKRRGGKYNNERCRSWSIVRVLHFAIYKTFGHGTCEDNKYDEDKEDVGQEYNTSKMQCAMRYGYARRDEETFRLWRAGRPNVTKS